MYVVLLDRIFTFALLSRTTIISGSTQLTVAAKDSATNARAKGLTILDCRRHVHLHCAMDTIFDNRTLHLSNFNI